jgi:hypothetical protein
MVAVGNRNITKKKPSRTMCGGLCSRYDAAHQNTGTGESAMTVRALPCLIAAFALVGALPAQAASSGARSTSAQTVKTAKKQNSHSVKFIKNPNQETPADRERRLARECKGMPNAGACLGYGS